VKDFIARYQVPASAWYVANPDLTVVETRRCRRSARRWTSSWTGSADQDRARRGSARAVVTAGPEWQGGISPGRVCPSDAGRPFRRRHRDLPSQPTSRRALRSPRTARSTTFAYPNQITPLTLRHRLTQGVLLPGQEARRAGQHPPPSTGHDQPPRTPIDTTTPSPTSHRDEHRAAPRTVRRCRSPKIRMPR
jgi:hypothetical protein